MEIHENNSIKTENLVDILKYDLPPACRIFEMISKSVVFDRSDKIKDYTNEDIQAEKCNCRPSLQAIPIELRSFDGTYKFDCFYVMSLCNIY